MKYKKKLNLPNRRRYSSSDPFIRVPYDKNNPEDINKLFEKAMKLYEKCTIYFFIIL